MPVHFTFDRLKKDCAHIDPDFRVMILRDFCDEIRSGKILSFTAAEEKIVVDCLAERFTGFERVKDVQSEAIRTLELIIPILSPAALHTLTVGFVEASRTEANTYIKEQRVAAEYVPLLRENGCQAIRMILKRMSNDAQGEAASAFVQCIVGPFLQAIAKQADDPAKRDFYEVLQPILSTMGSYVTTSHCQAIYDQLRKDWGCQTAHLYNQLVSVNAALFPLLSEDQFKSALGNLLKDLDSRGEAFRRNLNAFIAVIRTSSNRVGDKVPDLFRILNAELKRLESEQTDDTENDEARASILDSLRVLVRDCPREAEPFLANVVSVATTLVAWDPNYCGEDETDNANTNGATTAAAAGSSEYDEYGGGGDGDDYADYYNDEYGGDYGDDQQQIDDFSWRVRLSAAALLVTVLRNGSSSGNRSGAEATLKQLVDGTSPLLVKRLKDRVESVKLEVYEVLIAALDLVSSERSVAFAPNQQAMQNQQTTNIGLAYGRDTNQQLDALPSAVIFDAVQNSIISILTGEMSDSKSAKVSSKATDALRKFMLVRDINALSNVSQIVSCVQPLLVNDESRKNASAVLPSVLQLLRFLVVRATAEDAKSSAPAASTALFSLASSVEAACVDKIPAVARAAIELAAEIATVSDAYSVAMFKAVGGALTNSDIEVKGAAITAIARIVAANKSQLASAGDNFDATFAVLADMLTSDASRRIVSHAIRSIARSGTIPQKFVTIFGDLLVKSINRADRQEREAAIGALAALIATRPAGVSQEAFNAVIVALGEGPSTTATFVEKELTISALSFQLAAAVAASKNAAVVSKLAEKVAPRMLDFLSKGSVQGLPVLEAGRAFFALSSGTDCAHILKLAESAFAADAHGNTPVAYGALVAADSNAARRTQTVSRLAQLVSDPVMGARAASALGEVGRFTDLTAFADATAGLLVGTFKSEEISLAVTNALCKATSSKVGGALFAKLLAAGVNGANYIASRALRASISEGAMSVFQHPLSDPAVHQTTLKTLIANAAADIPEVQESIGQLAVWNVALVLAEINTLLASGSEDLIAAAGYALRFTLRNARGNGSQRGAILAACVKYLGNFSRPGKVLVRRNALMLLKALLSEGLYTAEVHAVAFKAVAAEMSVDATLVKLTDLGVVKHREDRGVDLRRNAFDFVRDVIAAPEASFLTSEDFTAIAVATVAALGPTSGLESEEDEDIIAAARKKIFTLNKIPSAWAAITSPDLAAVAKYMAQSLKAKPKDGASDNKKEEDNIILAIALLIFFKTAVGAEKLAPLADKVKDAEGNALAPRARLLLNGLTA